VLKLRQFCICNTDISTGGGLHWFVLLKTDKSTLEYFDSLGVSENKLNNLKRFSKFKTISIINYNETAFQKQDSDSCGLFVLYFLFKRMFNLDLTFEEILDDIFEINNNTNELNVSNFCINILKEESDYSD
jgi:hypothetical protein